MDNPGLLICNGDFVMKKKNVLVPFLFVFLLVSCTTKLTLTTFPASPQIREDAADISFEYLGMTYQWGGQSFWWDEGGTVDCSGFVINVYKEACARYNKQLLFDDTTAVMLHDRYTVAINTPEIGDLIFMGEENEPISHVALFLRSDETSIFFIDAYSVDGVVEERNYEWSNPKIKGFGRMLII
jgi:hypothetical protein